MKYISTRGSSGYASFEQVLFSGYAPDGGLFVPDQIPKFDINTIADWKSKALTYTQVVEKVVRQYISLEEIPDDKLSLAIEKAYARFERNIEGEILAVRNLIDGTHEVKIVELYHGPTKSFKDYALALVGQLMDYFLQKRQKHTTILVGTSGDTGSAAMEAVRGLNNVDIIVLYPSSDKVSKVQELQMQTILDSNVHLFQVEGNSDDLDVPISQCFPNPKLCCINSINWTRIMIQISHYIYLYLQNNNSDPVNIIVPTGASGNIVAGIYAIQMGFPINLYAATNENQCLHNVISTGRIQLGDKVITTPANAMDIQNPYNLERILHLSSCKPNDIAKFMTSKEAGTVDGIVLENMKAFIKGSLSVSNDQIYATIKSVWDSNQVVICPHTATAFYYWKNKLTHISGNSYILSTAAPEKFLESANMAGIEISPNGKGIISRNN